MNFLNLAESRFSVRSFSDRKVEKEAIEKILRAGQVADRLQQTAATDLCDRIGGGFGKAEPLAP